ncbi:MAG: thioesterase family protein [Hyphomonadaceae bacterium]|nr:thioesterase family protein [Hyphomonadaceae bacterium]
MIPLWKGSANTWDCDEMGHMNVRIYVEKAMEALGAFAHAIDLPSAFSPRSSSTLIPREHHIRYIREVLPGRPLSMIGCVVDWGEDWVDLYQDMRHGDGMPAAAIRTRLVHATAASEQSFPWSSRTRTRLEALKDTPPKETAPRSLVPGGEVRADADISDALIKAAGIPQIGQGMVLASHCDVFGTMWAPWFMGRVSDAVPNLLYDWRRRVAESAGGAPMGAAVMEYRMIYRRWPRVGDLFEIYTGLASVAEKTHSLVHWMLDPVSGRPWMTAEAVAVTFDLDKRKVIPTPPAMMAELEEIAPKGLTL